MRNIPRCIDCGAQLKDRHITRCRTCYTIAREAAQMTGGRLSPRLSPTFNMRSDWRSLPDGTQVRLYGDLTGAALG